MKSLSTVSQSRDTRVAVLGLSSRLFGASHFSLSTIMVFYWSFGEAYIMPGLRHAADALPLVGAAKLSPAHPGAAWPLPCKLTERRVNWREICTWCDGRIAKQMSNYCKIWTNASSMMGHEEGQHRKTMRIMSLVSVQIIPWWKVWRLRETKGGTRDGGHEQV